MSGAGLPPLREVIARHGLDARKSLGQHFLLDLNLTGRIARAAAPLAGHTVIEVGPGPGGLTRALLAEGADRVVAVERDPRCLAALAGVAAACPGRLEVVEGDALELDTTALGPPPRKVVANLPYNVSTPLLLAWLKQADAFTALVLMFQKEVVDRLKAHPGSRTYGRLSVMIQWRCTVEPLFDVGPRAFIPPPRVDSTVVRLIPRAEPLAPAPFAALERVVAAAFNQRRKMLRQSLKALGVPDTEALIRSAGLVPTQRAETVDVAGFCALARTWAGEARSLSEGAALSPSPADG